MTPQRASILLNTEMRQRERRARIGTRCLVGSMPTIREIQRQFGVSHSAAQNWHIRIRDARKEFAA